MDASDLTFLFVDDTVSPKQHCIPSGTERLAPGCRSKALRALSNARRNDAPPATRRATARDASHTTASARDPRSSRTAAELPSATPATPRVAMSRNVHVRGEGRSRRPARTMVDRVQLHERCPKSSREKTRERGLARTRCADDEHSLHFELPECVATGGHPSFRRFSRPPFLAPATHAWASRTGPPASFGCRM
jgi:hypothetical protein